MYHPENMWFKYLVRLYLVLHWWCIGNFLEYVLGERYSLCWILWTSNMLVPTTFCSDTRVGGAPGCIFIYQSPWKSPSGRFLKNDPIQSESLVYWMEGTIFHPLQPAKFNNKKPWNMRVGKWLVDGDGKIQGRIVVFWNCGLYTAIKTICLGSFCNCSPRSKLGPSRMLALKQPGTLLLSNFEHRIHCRMPFYLLGKNSIPQVKQKTEQHFWKQHGNLV